MLCSHVRRVHSKCKRAHVHSAATNVSERSDDINIVLDQLDKGTTHGDIPTFASLLRKCSSSRQAKRIHSHITESTYRDDSFLANLLVQLYGKCGELDRAKSVFDSIINRSTYSWNSIIGAYAQNGHIHLALELFQRMELEGVKPTGPIFVTLLSVCCNEQDIEQGKKIHTRVILCGYGNNLAVQNTLVNLYGKAGSLEDAFCVFREMPEKDIVSWNAMISAYAQRGYSEEALELYEQIKPAGLRPTHVTFVNVIRACSALGELSKAEEIHRHVVEHGFDSNLTVLNSLINMYGRCKSAVQGRKVFDSMKAADKNIITWNSMIGVSLQCGNSKTALKVFFEEMDIQPNRVTFVGVLSACTDPTMLNNGKRIHEMVSSSGCSFDDVICSSLVNMYGKCGSVHDALEVFKQSQTGLASWTGIIAAYAQNGYNEEAFTWFRKMDLEGIRPNQATFVAVLGACSTLKHGKELQKRIETHKFESDVVVGTALVKMYDSLGMVENAEKIFNRISYKDVFAWTTMMEVYLETDCEHEAELTFKQMELEGMKPSEVTFIGVLEACSCVEHIKRIHTQATESGMEDRNKVATSLVKAYGKFKHIECARYAFEMATQKDLVLWNAIVGAYARNKLGKQAYDLFRRMDMEGIRPDSVTFIALLDACESSEDVRHAHECIESCGYVREVNVVNALISTWSKFGSYDVSRCVFDGLWERDLVTWSAMIAAYAQHGMYENSFELFREMHCEGVLPEETVFLIILFSASHTGLVENSLHYFSIMVRDCCVVPRLEHYSCVIDGLGRAGWLGFAEELVENMPFKADAVQWITLLGWCRVHSDVQRGFRAAERIFELEPENGSPYALLSGTFSS